MADELIGKPPSLNAAGSRSKNVRSGTTVRSVTQPEDEILLQILLQLQRQSIADGSVRVDGAGRLHTFSRKPSRSQSLPLHLVPATGA
jgi:hypothetical protein